MKKDIICWWSGGVNDLDDRNPTEKQINFDIAS